MYECVHEVCMCDVIMCMSLCTVQHFFSLQLSDLHWFHRGISFSSYQSQSYRVCIQTHLFEHWVIFISLSLSRKLSVIIASSQSDASLIHFHCILSRYLTSHNSLHYRGGAAVPHRLHRSRHKFYDGLFPVCPTQPNSTHQKPNDDVKNGRRRDLYMYFIILILVLILW